jgi:hypothetical protein
MSAVLVGVLLAGITATVLPASLSHAAAGTPPGVTVPVHTGQTVTPQHMQIKGSSSPIKPSAQELKQQQAALAAVERPHTPKLVVAPKATEARAAVSGPPVQPLALGKPASPANGIQPHAEGDFTPYSSLILQPYGPGVPVGSYVNPSVGQFGSSIFSTGNNYFAASGNSGLSWTYGDPATVFGTDYCCEQRVLFEPTRTILVWEAEIYNPSDNSTPGIGFFVETPSCDAGYSVDYATFGLPTNEILAFPDLSVGLDDLYVSFRAYTPSFATYTGTYIARFDLDTLATCSAATPTYYGSPSMFGFAMAGGGHGMYFGSNTYLSSTGCTLSTCASGTQMRIFQWTEGASSVTYSDHTVATFPYLSAGSGNCASQDGVVTNWCDNIDSTVSTAYYSRAAYRGYGPGVLGFAWTQGPITGDPFPSVMRVYFALPSLTFKSSDMVFNPGYAIVAPAFATNVFGFVGGVMSYGGGSGSGGSAVDYYPASLTLLEDTDSPTQPWNTHYVKGTTNSPSADWSVRNSIRPDLPAGEVFIAASILAGPLGTAETGPTPYVVTFGRERYADSYNDRTFWG